MERHKIGAGRGSDRCASGVTPILLTGQQVVSRRKPRRHPARARTKHDRPASPDLMDRTGQALRQTRSHWTR